MKKLLFLIGLLLVSLTISRGQSITISEFDLTFSLEKGNYTVISCQNKSIVNSNKKEKEITLLLKNGLFAKAEIISAPFSSTETPSLSSVKMWIKGKGDSMKLSKQQLINNKWDKLLKAATTILIETPEKKY